MFQNQLWSVFPELRCLLLLCFAELPTCSLFNCPHNCRYYTREESFCSLPESQRKIVNFSQETMIFPPIHCTFSRMLGNLILKLASWRAAKDRQLLCFLQSVASDSLSDHCRASPSWVVLLLALLFFKCKLLVKSLFLCETQHRNKLENRVFLCLIMQHLWLLHQLSMVYISHFACKQYLHVIFYSDV